MAWENASPRPEEPRGFAATTRYPFAAKSCQVDWKDVENWDTGPPWIQRMVG